MKQYLALGREIIDTGFQHPDRTGNGRISIFGKTMRFNLQEGFPMVTTKQVFWKGIMKELEWFIRGSTDALELEQDKVGIWKEWTVRDEHLDMFMEKLLAHHAAQGLQTISAEEQGAIKESLRPHIGSIGNLYGASWRRAPQTNPYPSPFKTAMEVYDTMLSDDQEQVRDLLAQYDLSLKKATEAQLQDAVASVAAKGVDQLAYSINELKTKPYSSRNVLSAWIPEWVPDDSLSPQMNVLLGKGALAACHCLVQFFVKPPLEEGGKMRLTCLSYQRSCDFFLGVPFNIASYAALTMMIAQVVDMEPDEFIWQGGDIHFYPKHVEKFEMQEKREPFPLPKLILPPDVKDILKFRYEDMKLEDYQHHEAIKAEIAI